MRVVKVSCSEVDPGEDTESRDQQTDPGSIRGCSEVDPGEDTESSVGESPHSSTTALQ